MKKTIFEIELLKELIARPSYDDGQYYESALTDYVKKFMAKELPAFACIEQKVAPNRSNLFFSNCANPRMLIINHLDTVKPTSGWKTNPFEAIVKDNKVYGLGSSDTKGNIAALIGALRTIDTSNLALAILFYVDEEYYFAGMKKYAKSELAKTIDPEYVMSIDGSGLRLGLGCRGVIECQVAFRGKSGHAANPGSGLNAIMASYRVFKSLEEWLAQYNSDVLGSSSLNVAKLSAGTLLANGELANSGNIIPDYCEAILEIRSASARINADRIKSFIIDAAVKQGLIVDNFQTKLDLGCFQSSPADLKEVIELLQPELGRDMCLDLKTFGYLDQQMLADVYPQAKFFSLGCGEIGQAHKCNEYNKVSNIPQAKEIYAKLLTYLARSPYIAATKE